MTYGCNIKAGKMWVRVECATELELDVLIALLEERGIEVA